MGNDGVKGNGKGWQIGEIALPGKGKDIGRYWCVKKWDIGHGRRRKCAQVGQRACPCWATCLPHLGNVLAQKRDKKRCREEGMCHHLANISSDKPQV